MRNRRTFLFIPMKKYELFPGAFANKGQEQAIDGLLEFLDSDKKEAVLIGRGGTGKTTIIKKVLELNNQQFAGCALSHKAVRVLRESINNVRSSKGKYLCKSIGTLASFVGIELNEETGEFIINNYERKRTLPIEKYNLYIIDECSMISNDIRKEIVNLMSSRCKIIYLGDSAQLPPIGQIENSSIFTDENVVKFELVEKMRQAASSPIIKIGEKISANIESSEVKNRCITKRTDMFDEESKSSVKFMSFENAIDSFVEDFKQNPNNPNHVKAITFNNQFHSHPESVMNLNKAIRKKLFGHLPFQQYFEGEMLVAYESYTDPTSNTMVFNNSDEFIVLDARPGTLTVRTSNYTRSRPSDHPDYVEFKKDYNVIYLDLLMEKDGEELELYDVPVIANTSRLDYDNDLKTFFSKAHTKVLAFRVKAFFANIYYGYAITTHKSQGSSYTNAYVFEDNILGFNAGSNDKTKNKALYVAVSRPRKKLVMVSSYKEPSIKIVKRIKEDNG